MDTITMATVATAIISGLGIFVALLAVWAQTRQNNRALGVTILRDLEKDFLWSDEMKKKRYALAKFLLTRKEGEVRSPEVGYMLDFFDSMGLYHNKGVIDTEMAWVMFYYWLGHYWHLLKKDADASESEEGITYYNNIRLFYNRLTKFGQIYRNLPAEEIYFSSQNLRDFLMGELRKCSPAENEYPNEQSFANLS